MGLDLAQEPHGFGKDRITLGSKLNGPSHPFHPFRNPRKDQVFQVRVHLVIVEIRAIGAVFGEPGQKLLEGRRIECRVVPFGPVPLGLTEGELLDAEVQWNTGAGGLREELPLEHREGVVADLEIGEHAARSDQFTPSPGLDDAERVGLFGERVTLGRPGPMEGSSQRSLPLSGREPKVTCFGEPEHVLEDAFSEGSLADHQGSVVVL